MTKEEYDKRLEKTTEKIKTDRCSEDEIANINRQKLYLAEHYISSLEQENKQLKDNWNKLKEYISTEWYSYDNDSVEFEVAKDILNKMEEMIGGDK